ncbi:MAG TPA: helix-turn-helix transcriptional regulator [Acetobacteraceae bacterium]|jgi:transcriptional regulator with XRE-family HTH domain|nr:helix-turn-helix transcriptional regulator [Acetobacteraceae bacterium]
MNSTATDHPDDEVGARIAEARRAAGMTQQALGDAVGVSRSAVAQWETGRAGQLRGNLARIATALGVSAAYLLEGGAGRGDGAAENATEMALLRLYRACTEPDRALLLQTALRLARAGPAGGE